jgi:hypothetical protein
MANNRVDQKYWQPLPIWKGEQWSGIVFGKLPSAEGMLWEIGLIFEQPNYGERVFRAISAWNDSKSEDIENRICVSFIIEENDEYLAYVYPNLIDLKPDELNTICIICKMFPNPSTSSLRRFQQIYDGGSYLLRPYTFVDGVPQPLSGVEPILKSHLKIEKWDALKPTDVEYQHRKKVIGL